MKLLKLITIYGISVSAAVLTLQAKPGIKGIYVFGDSLSDAGNAHIWAQTHEPAAEPINAPFPYYEGRATNGPVWIEIAAQAYGYSVVPSQAGGRNYAFIGAESGWGMSDQGTPNFQAQIRLFETDLERLELETVHPWDLFVIWFGANDFLRILNTVQRPIVPEDIVKSVNNIELGIRKLQEYNARHFLIPAMPDIDLTPFGQSLSEEMLTVLQSAVDGFNAELEARLEMLDAEKHVNIYRLKLGEFFEQAIADSEIYSLTNVTDAALDEATGEVVEDVENYLFWDGFHPTVAGHSILAQLAMDVIPIGSWWGHSVARGPDGTAFLGMGWVNDEHWPWTYSYSLEGGKWMWTLQQGGSPEGYLAYVPTGYKWLFINAMSGWYYDYSEGRWKKLPEE